MDFFVNTFLLSLSKRILELPHPRKIEWPQKVFGQISLKKMYVFFVHHPINYQTKWLFLKEYNTFQAFHILKQI